MTVAILFPAQPPSKNLICSPISSKKESCKFKFEK